MTLPRPLAVVVGWLGWVAAMLLHLGVTDRWSSGVRAPLAIAVFLVLPGLGLLGALRLRLDLVSAAAAAIGLSLALDLLAATVLVLTRAATLPHLLLALGGTALLAAVAAAAPGRRP